MEFAPFVDAERRAIAAADIIKACANEIQSVEMQKERKPQILVPRIGFGL
jgi:hypothetical protein